MSWDSLGPVEVIVLLAIAGGLAVAAIYYSVAEEPNWWRAILLPGQSDKPVLRRKRQGPDQRPLRFRSQVRQHSRGQMKRWPRRVSSDVMIITVILAVFAAVIIFAGNDGAGEGTTYYRDTRTGLCFVETTHKLANVPCESIPGDLPGDLLEDR